MELIVKLDYAWLQKLSILKLLNFPIKLRKIPKINATYPLVFFFNLF